MANSVAFPNRPCPGCGKPIHIKSRSHDCGWHAEPDSAKVKSSARNGKISKMEAVRQVLGDHRDMKPLEIQDEVKKRFNIKMDPSTISNYKGAILRKGLRKKPGRPAVQTRTEAGKTGNISFDDIRAVKELAERLGPDKLRQLAELLG